MEEFSVKEENEKLACTDNKLHDFLQKSNLGIRNRKDWLNQSGYGKRVTWDFETLTRVK